MIEYATVEASDIRTGEAFIVDGVNYTAASDAEFVRSAGSVQILVRDDSGNRRFLELTEKTYDIAYYAQYAAS